MNIDELAERADLQLKVWQEDGGWYAQSDKIDYLACGDTEDQARLHYWHGLAMTLYANWVKFGHVDNFLKRQPGSADAPR